MILALSHAFPHLWHLLCPLHIYIASCWETRLTPSASHRFSLLTGWSSLTADRSGRRLMLCLVLCIFTASWCTHDISYISPPELPILAKPWYCCLDSPRAQWVHCPKSISSLSKDSVRLVQLPEGQCLAKYNKIFAEGAATPSRDQR